jgi:hypothetical protein
MSGYGKLNLAAMLLLPLVAASTAVIMFGPRFDTMATVFGLNFVPMLVGGLFSALLLRGANRVGGSSRFIALWPTLVTAAIGIVWYLSGALVPAELDPGREYIAAPQYLLGCAVIMGIVAWVGCRITRMVRNNN